jgi:hypothetical protein
VIFVGRFLPNLPFWVKKEINEKSPPPPNDNLAVAQNIYIERISRSQDFV